VITVAETLGVVPCSGQRHDGAGWLAMRPGRISVIQPGSPEKPDSRHDGLVDEDQRRDLLRSAEDEVRRASREHGRDSPQARAERQRQLGLERSTAAELGLPYAERVDLGVMWDAGTPMPMLLSGLRTFVAFYLSVRHPLFDGTNPRVRDPQADHGIGVVEFKRMTSVKIGSPNDEALRGHPLWGSGLESYSAHEVKNSPWITELMEANRAHEHFDESQWTGRRHFMLTFHDETLECVAKWTITRAAPGATMPEVLARLSAEAL
jgi:hypothetical protein